MSAEEEANQEEKKHSFWNCSVLAHSEKVIKAKDLAPMNNSELRPQVWWLVKWSVVFKALSVATSGLCLGFSPGRWRSGSEIWTAFFNLISAFISDGRRRVNVDRDVRGTDSKRPWPGSRKWGRHRAGRASGTHVRPHGGFGQNVRFFCPGLAGLGRLYTHSKNTLEEFGLPRDP